MNRAELKGILRQQSSLFNQAVEDKLRCLITDENFNSDVFEEVEPQYSDDEFEKAFEEDIDQQVDENKIVLMPKSENDLDNIYSHRAEALARELPKNKIVSYQEKLAALRGISMVEDFKKTQC